MLSDSNINTSSNTGTTNNVIITGELTGAGKITNGGGAATLVISGTGNDTFTGGITVASGRVRIDADGAQGTGTLLAKDAGIASAVTLSAIRQAPSSETVMRSARHGDAIASRSSRGRMFARCMRFLRIAGGRR